MRHPVRSVAVTLVFLCAVPALGWWDTVVKNWKYPPLVQRYEAESLAEKGVGVADDPLSSGGKAVSVRPAGPLLAFTRDLSPSVYGVYIVGRSPREGDTESPGSMKPFYFRVTVFHLASGAKESYRLRAAYQYIYPLTYGPEDMARCFFRVHRPGKVRIEVSADKGSEAAPLLVDRIELRDVLGNCAKKAGKTRRTMIRDEELANLRGGDLKPVPVLRRDKVLARCEAYWASFPPPNAPRQDARVPKGWKMSELDTPWAIVNEALNARYTLEDFQAGRRLPGPVPDDGWGVAVSGRGWPASIIAPLFRRRVAGLANLMKQKAAYFERTGDPRAGLDGAALLLAFAYNYPLLDYRSQAAWPSKYGRFYFTNHTGGGIVQPGQREGHAVRDYVRTYDRLYEFIVANPSLADFLATKIPGVRTTKDVVRFLDVNLLQRTADVILRCDVQGDSLKMSRALTMAAICQGPNEISQRWVDTLFNEIPMGMIEPGGIEDLAYGNLGRDGLVSKGSGGYSKGSIMSLLEVATLLRRYAEMGGKVPVDLTDVKKHPWFADALYAPINLRVAGGWVPLIGDYGDPLRTREVYFDRGPRRAGSTAAKPFYLQAWRFTGDPKFAFLTHRYGRTVESAEEWARIEAAARKTRDPLNILPPRLLDDFGLAILETGQRYDDFRKKCALTLRYGHGHTHGHNDGLAVSFWAKGMRAISDLAARAGSPNPRLQKMHNTVEVDRKSMNNGGETIPGYGWLNAFVPFEGVQYADASQRGISHPEIKTYRRGVALIDVGDQDAYVFDVFRVAGGRVHTWCAHANQNDRFEVNAPLSPAKSPEAVAYLTGFKTPQTKLDERYLVKDLLPRPVEGRAPDALVATWRLHPRAEKAFLGEELPEDRKVFVRRRLFGHGGDTLLAADGTSKRYRYDMSFLYVQNLRASEAGSIYPSLAEVYQGKPVVQSARALNVADAGDGVAKCVAVEVKLPGNVTDVCLSGPGDGKARRVEGGLTFDGLFGFVRRDARGLVRAVLVGGTRLEGNDFHVRLPRGRVVGKVVSTQPDRNTCQVEGDFKGVTLVGRTALFVAPSGRKKAYTVKAAEPAAGGVRLTLKERMKVLQSAVRFVNEEAREISLVAEPYNLKADQHAYDSIEVANESLTKRWNARIVTDTRWMIVKTPVSAEDIPDRDGDGRRALTLLGGAADKEKAGKPVLVMEVVRVDEARRTIYFKTPPPPYNIGGWGYVDRVLVSESGKKWQGTYPGIEYKVVVEGPVKMGDFDDANGDGRKVLSVYQIRPGFTMVLPASVSVVRTAPGEYGVEALMPAKVRVPGKVAASK